MEHASVLKGAKCWFQITNVRFQFNGQPVNLCIDLNPVTNEYSEEGNAKAGGKEALNDWKKYMLLMVEKHHVCVILEKS